MPMYEYRCGNCGKEVSLHLTYDEYGTEDVHCPHCESSDLKRLIGRVCVTRSEGSRLDSLSDPGDWGDLDDADPRSMARMVRKMSEEMGEDMPPEIGEVVDRLESGESPEEIEKSMPEMGGFE